MEDKLIVPIGLENSICDESRYAGTAFSKSAPKSAEEVAKVIKHCRKSRDCITVHGGLTGINGAGVPTTGHAMSTVELCKISYNQEDNSVWAEAGASFSEIEKAVRIQSCKEREFPASPSEKTATIGGALSVGAAGLRSFKYGGVAQYINEIEFCDNQGNINRLKRGEKGFNDFLGSEGMCGIITGVRLSTVPTAKAIWAIMFFFKNDSDAAALADEASKFSAVGSLEYLDAASFSVVDEFKKNMAAIAGLPSMPYGQSAAIYIEIEGETEEDIEIIAEKLTELSENCGGDPNIAWSASGDEVEKLRAFRHAVSECINMKIALTHGTDLRVKKLSLAIRWNGLTRNEILKYYRSVLDGENLSYCIFGHLGTYSPYIDILSSNAEEYLRGREVIKRICTKAYSKGDNAFSELGVGKLYREIYCESASARELNKKIKAKRRFDGTGIFNPGNMFTDTVL